MSEFVEDVNEYTTVENTEEKGGIVQIADDVVASIAALAVTEVDGVAKLTGNIPNELVAKLGKKNLSRGVKVNLDDKNVKVDVSVEVKYGYNLVKVSREIQERVKTAILNMTGLNVLEVNIKISGIEMKED